MSISVYNQALSYYHMYVFTTNSIYQENLAQASGVSEACYQIPDVTNALAVLNETSSVDLTAISNVENYAKNVYQLSQIDICDNLRGLDDSDVAELLSNSADLSGIYALLSSADLLSEDYLDYAAGGGLSGSSFTETDMNDLSESGSNSILDVFA